MIKKTLKERTGGLFLLILAGLIVTGISINSRQVESKNQQSLAPVEQPSQEGQILGETDNDSEEISSGAEKITQETVENDDEKNADEKTDEGKNLEEEKEAETEDNYYTDLKRRLEKYCGKRDDIKKCKDCLTEAKSARNKGGKFNDLYKKYHFEKKKVAVSNNTISSTASENIKTTLVIKLNGDSKSYEIESAKGISVLELMKQGGVSYDILKDGRIDNIGGEKKESGTMSWMLYACKNGTCKMTPVGPAEFKIDGYDKFEWRYLDWMAMGMDGWNTW